MAAPTSSSFVEGSPTGADVASREPARHGDPLTELEALDQDSPEEVLKTFAIMSVVAAFVCLVPRLYVSTGLLVVLAVTLLVIRRRRLRAGGDEARRGASPARSALARGPSTGCTPKEEPDGGSTVGRRVDLDRTA
jgi:hypothetical protein